MSKVDSVWRLEREIPSDPAMASALAEDLIVAMQQRDWPVADQFRTQLAYEEAVTNAIRHGNQGDLDKSVQVEMSCDDQQVQISVTDQGKGFDPAAVPDPRQDELLEVPGGRGVLLINEVMSSVEYNDRGNQVQMIKRRGDE